MRDETRRSYQRAAQRVIEHIHGHLDSALDLGSLAREAGLSPFHFHRIFRGMVGETPLELTRRLRLERAAWTLAHTGDRVTGIAFDAGYETHEAFTRAFRAAYGTPPSAFRVRAYPRMELAATCGIHYRPSGELPQFSPRETGGANMDVTIVDRPGLRVATVRHSGPYNQIPQAFERLGQIAGQSGLFQYPEAAMIAVYHDDPDSVAPAELRSDAGIAVPRDIELPAELGEQHLPAGPYARFLHVGPYETLGDTWAKFMGEWLPASGRRIAPGLCYERYLNSPMDMPPEKLETELYIPLA